MCLLAACSQVNASAARELKRAIRNRIKILPCFYIGSKVSKLSGDEKSNTERGRRKWVFGGRTRYGGGSGALDRQSAAFIDRTILPLALYDPR